jgi:Uma2 family endonuclease
MSVMPVTPRESGEWTVDDLDQLPTDDGMQYELLDGILLVTPGPVMEHQSVAGELYVLLRAARTPEMRLLFAPFDWRPDRRTSLQPDLLVFRKGDVSGGQAKCVETPLVLAVEILSPSTRSKDLVWKRDKYERAGVEHYWIVDPAEPSIVALELQDGGYVEVGRASGAESLHLERPFPVAITPADLLTS